MFYDGNQGCYYYFDVIAQKYRLHSQVHSETPQVSVNEPVSMKQQNILENITEDSDSDNSEDSGNLVIKEDTEEDTEQNEKEIKDDSLCKKTLKECNVAKNVVKPEVDSENSAAKEEKEEVKTENCPPPPPSTCEVCIYLIF